jgi:uncharacterized protein (TIGR02466 family)
MKIQPIFSNFIATDFLNIDNDLLAVYCKKQYQEQKIINPTAPCGFDLLDPAIKLIADKFTEKLNEVHNQLGFVKGSKQEIAKAWINVNSNPYIDAAHNHPGWFFVGVYYVKADPASGRITYLNPNSGMVATILPGMVENGNIFNCSDFNQPPIPGTLVIFPSWLMHYVTQNTGESERISIAFNSRIIMPGGLNEYN